MEVEVEAAHTTSHTGSPILSTPKMISLMESVAYHSVQPLLPPGSVTVGYEVHVKHKAPAPIGAVIQCPAACSKWMAASCYSKSACCKGKPSSVRACTAAPL